MPKDAAARILRSVSEILVHELLAAARYYIHLLSLGLVLAASTYLDSYFLPPNPTFPRLFSLVTALFLLFAILRFLVYEAKQIRRLIQEE
jgi:polyferredoxin